MKRFLLDRYVGRLYLGALGATLFALTSVWLVADFFTHVDDMAAALAEERLEASGTAFAGLVARYLLVQLPFFLHRLAPLIPLAAAVLTLQRLLRTHELLPAVAAGLSLYRIFRAPFLLAGLFAALVFAGQELLLPRLSFTREVLARRIRGKAARELTRLPLLMDRRGNRYHIERYDPHPRRRQATGFLLVETVSEGGRSGFRRLVAASTARYDPERRRWLLGRGSYEEVFTPAGTWARRPVTELRRSRLEPRQIEEARLEMPARSLRDLGRLWRRTHDPTYLLGLHRQAAHPLKALLLLFLGLPFLFRAYQQHLPVGRVFRLVLVCGLFYAVDFLGADLAVRRELHPLVGAWLPVLLGGSAALALQARVCT